MKAEPTPLAASPLRQELVDIQLPPTAIKGTPPNLSSTVSGQNQTAPSNKPTPKPATTAPQYPHPPPPLPHANPQRLSSHPNKPAMGAIAPQIISAMEGPRLSMTSKEWVIPPRPKPGRKPATDTPPTKRKAQNRAAQRAFRERRAARVGELEEQLDEQRQEQDRVQSELKDKVRSLELDVQSFKSRCALLENMLERERQDRVHAETEGREWRRRYEEDSLRRDSLARSRRQSFDRQRNEAHLQPSVEYPPDGQSLHQLGHNASISHMFTPPEMLDGQTGAPLTCGNCSPTGPCACAEEVLAALPNCGRCGLGSRCSCLDQATDEIFGQGQSLKRPASPSAPSAEGKRHRSVFSTGNDATGTSLPTTLSRNSTMVLPEPTQHNAQAPPPPLDNIPFKDGCGFCNEGTYCVCAAMETPALTPVDDTLPPITLQTETPPPSETDMLTAPIPMEMTADGAVKLPPRRSQSRKKTALTTSRTCGPNGPGTCAQCQADPKSGLFCRLMAARLENEQDGASGGCCGGKGPEGGCCKTKNASKEKTTLPSLNSLGLSCAQAYQTLSSHRNFEKAADDIGSWLPKLKTTSANHGPHASRHARMPMEVEAASIMSVLKDFDVRFGREA